MNLFKLFQSIIDRIFPDSFTDIVENYTPTYKRGDLVKSIIGNAESPPMSSKRWYFMGGRKTCCA